MRNCEKIRNMFKENWKEILFSIFYIIIAILIIIISICNNLNIGFYTSLIASVSGISGMALIGKIIIRTIFKENTSAAINKCMKAIPFGVLIILGIFIIVTVLICSATTLNPLIVIFAIIPALVVLAFLWIIINILFIITFSFLKLSVKQVIAIYLVSSIIYILSLKNIFPIDHILKMLD